MNKDNTLDKNLSLEKEIPPTNNAFINSKKSKIPYILIAVLVLTNCITGFFAVRLYYSNKLNIAILLDKLINEINYFYTLTNPSDF